MFRNPMAELTSERENEIIEKMASEAVKRKLDVPALMVLEISKPFFVIFGSTGLASIAIFLELLGIKGFEYASFCSKRSNLYRLIERIEDLKKEAKSLE